VNIAGTKVRQYREKLEAYYTAVGELQKTTENSLAYHIPA